MNNEIALARYNSVLKHSSFQFEQFSCFSACLVKASQVGGRRSGWTAAGAIQRQSNSQGRTLREVSNLLEWAILAKKPGDSWMAFLQCHVELCPPAGCYSAPEYLFKAYAYSRLSYMNKIYRNFTYPCKISRQTSSYKKCFICLKKK